MSDESRRSSNHILERVPAQARFSRVPCWAGDGEVVLASTPEGCVVLVPPGMLLTVGEPPESRTHWRVAWYPAGENGVDLDGGPEQEEGGSLREIWALEQIDDVRPFLRAMFLADARHYATAHRNFYGVTEAMCLARVEPLRREWADLFPGERWPLDPPETASDAPARASSFAALPERVIATLLSRAPGPVLGTAAPDAARSAGPGRRINFGSAVSLSHGGEGSTPVLEVDFDQLPDDEGLGAATVEARLLTQADEIAGTGFFANPTGRQRAPITLTTSVDLNDVKVRLVGLES